MRRAIALQRTRVTLRRPYRLAAFGSLRQVARREARREKASWASVPPCSIGLCRQGDTRPPQLGAFTIVGRASILNVSDFYCATTNFIQPNVAPKVVNRA